MFGRETRMLLRHYLEHGASKSALARELGVSRDTIHRWIRAGELDRDLDDDPGAVRPAAGRCRRSSTPTRRSSRPASRPIPSCRRCGCSTEIRAAGYAGGYTQLKAFVRQVRPDAAAGAGGALRDARRPTGAGGLRRVSAFPWGMRYAFLVVLGLLAAAVVSVLSARRTCGRW